MESLLVLIERWHAYERDGDPEATEARHALELRLATLSGYVLGMSHYSPAAERLVKLIDGA
jgi:hypothetical protein